MQDRVLLPHSYADNAVAVNKVLKNTYMLLAMTLGLSAFTAFLSLDSAPLNIWVIIGGTYGLLFLTHMLANSAWGLAAVFAFTGFIGYTTGPIIGMFMGSAIGSQIVMQALGGTAIIFFALSGYALVSRKDFSFMSGFLFAGSIVLIVAMVAAVFLKLPALNLAISAGFMLFSSAVILYQTSDIIHGGERNYIRATVTLYVSIYNIFMSLLNLLSAFSGGDDR
jgi:modulator of FtsH protease